MKTAKKILSILLCCLMLTGLLSVGVFAAEGTQADPINANDKWFGYGVDCYLLNPTLDAGDTDGLWYQLTVEQAGILQLEHSYKDLDYSITLWVNDMEYVGFEENLINRPINTYPVAVGDVATINIKAQDTSLGGGVYANIKIMSGSDDFTQTMKIKSLNTKVYVSAGNTVYYQDDTNDAEFAAAGLSVSGDNVADTVITSSSKTYTDSDNDGSIELKLGGSQGGAGVPPSKPTWSITNNSTEDRCYILSGGLDATVHECVYDNASDVDCNTCGAIREVGCSHEYMYPCDGWCMICGEFTNPDATHSLTHVAAQEPTCTAEGNIEYWYCEDCGQAWLDELCHVNTNLMAVKLGASCKYAAVYNAAKAPTCDEEGNVEYWYCANCDVYYADADCSVITNAKSVILPVSHNVIHVEAQEPTCTTEGNIEYWYCEDCGQAWLDELCHMNTNLMAVKLGASCKYAAVYNAAKAATCYEEGNLEYWYCANCDVYYADADCTVITNAKSVILPVSHNVIHVEAKDPTCTELGNIEYWYCEDCGQAWLDELCHMNTNLRAVILPMADHTYDHAEDVDCNVCGEIRPVDYMISNFDGNSISADVNGLAFKYTMEISDIAIKAGYKNHADYTNATASINSTSEPVKVLGMGAIVTNNYSPTLVDYVDDVNTLDIPCVRLWENPTEDTASFAVRIINIPDDQKDTVICVRPYLIYEDQFGNVIYWYGLEDRTSYNAVLNGESSNP